MRRRVQEESRVQSRRVDKDQNEIVWKGREARAKEGSILVGLSKLHLSLFPPFRTDRHDLIG